MATTTKDKQQLGKPLPPGGTTAQHGTRTSYLYGCRCDPCRKAESNYQRERREARKAARVSEGS
jgi:hypothetical protein